MQPFSYTNTALSVECVKCLTADVTWVYVYVCEGGCERVICQCCLYSACLYFSDLSGSAPVILTEVGSSYWWWYAEFINGFKRQMCMEESREGQENGEEKGGRKEGRQQRWGRKEGVWRNQTHLARVTSKVEECKVEGERVKNKQEKHHEGGRERRKLCIWVTGIKLSGFKILFWTLEPTVIQRLEVWLTMASKHSSHAAQTCRVSLRQREDPCVHWGKCTLEWRHQVKTAASILSQALGQRCYLHVLAEFGAFLSCHYFWTSPSREGIPHTKPIYLLTPATQQGSIGFRNYSNAKTVERIVFWCVFIELKSREITEKHTSNEQTNL